MRTKIRVLLSATLLSYGVSALAAAYYVDVNCPNPLYPYTNWATAAKVIQDAVDAAAAAWWYVDEVVVTNGVYSTGGRAVSGMMTNRVAITTDVRLRSVNGPQFTIIRGYQVPGKTNGDGAIRCVYLANGASLSGFTLINGATLAIGSDGYGGGVWCEYNNEVSNCVITSNSAYYGGGGARGGTLYNCTLIGNSAVAPYVFNGSYGGGGAESATLNNCTLTGNTARYGGGAAGCTLNKCTLTGNSANAFDGHGGGAYTSWLNNCIVYHNTSDHGANYDYCYGFEYCCTTPLPPGTGNIATDPQLASANHLSAGSPCRGAGSAASGTDIDGEPWASASSIGCDEYRAGAVTGPLMVGIAATFTNAAVGFPVGLKALIEGRTVSSTWDFGDGVMATNQPYLSHGWRAPGDYVVTLRAQNESSPDGVGASVAVHVVAQPVHHVAAASLNPVPPYSSWATAASNIQDAVDAAAVPGALVLVTNGTYHTGGRAVHGAMTNRVAVDKPLTVQSVNGPLHTIVEGYQVPDATNGDGAMRCVYLAHGASLSGFTLTKGATRDDGDFRFEWHGGGLWCESFQAVVSNCVVTGNSAYLSGGGVLSGTLNNCSLVGNSAGYSGGGAFESMLNNCTVTGNSARFGGGASGSSHYLIRSTYANLNNCIVYFNTATEDEPNYDALSALNYCCTTPQPTNGIGNISNAPLFVDLAGGNLRLQSNSPCINAGDNAWVAGSVDLDGRTRLVDGTVDIGAYEFQPGVSGQFIGWLQQYGLPTDGSADSSDADGDGRNNWQEWRCLTDPADALSVLKMLAPSNAVSGVTVRWQSVAGMTYRLERSADLGAQPAFSILRSNLVGQAGTTSYTDTNAIGTGPFFYRVCVP